MLRPVTTDNSPSTRFNRAATSMPLRSLRSRHCVASVRHSCQRSADRHFGIAPFQQCVQSRRIGGEIHHAAQRAPFLLDAQQIADTGLAGGTGALQGIHVVRDDGLMLLGQQLRQAIEGIVLLDEQLLEVFAAQARVRGLFLLAEMRRKLLFEAEQLAGDSLAADLILTGVGIASRIFTAPALRRWRGVLQLLLQIGELACSSR